MDRKLVKIIIAYLAVYIVWGSTYLAIAWTVETIPPYYLVGIRFFVSGAALLLYALASGKLKRKIDIKELFGATVLAVFLLLGGNGFISVAEQTVDSYIAAIIVSSTPFCVAFFNRVFFKEKLSIARLLGMISGLAGVAVLLYDGESKGFAFSWGMLFIILGFLSWGFGTSISKKLTIHPDNSVNSGIEWVIAGVIALIISQFIYKPLPALISGISPKSWLGLVYLITIGSAALMAYNYLLIHEPTKRIVSYAIVNPLIAVLLGIFLGGEKAVPTLIPGLLIISIGLILILYGDNLTEKLARRRRDDSKSGS